MKYLLNILFLLIFLGCKTDAVKIEKSSVFYVGTYTKKESKGIYKYRMSEEGKLKNLGLMATITNPSFLTKSNNHKILFAIAETNKNGTGFVHSYLIKKDSLQLISTQKTGGADPCFVAINKNNYLIISNYSGGNIGLLKATKNGKIRALSDIQQHLGKGTTTRQTAANAHSERFHPIKNEVISVDLGTNELWFSTIDTTKNKLVFTHQKKLKMAVGAGPRHLSFHSNNKWIYILNELNNTVSLVKEKQETYFIDTTIATLPKKFLENSNAADIHISKDGKFLYVSNRGHNSIAIFEVNPKNGHLKIVGYEFVLGKNPRNFSLSPNEGFLLVANQDTDNIISFKRNTITGKLTFADEIPAPTPVCILF